MPGHGLWRWLVVGVIAVLAGAVSTQAVNAHLVFATLTEQLHATSDAAQVAPRPKTWSRAEMAQVQAVNAAIRELNLPISSILRALEPPRDIRVAVLSVETAVDTSVGTSSKTSSVKIFAEARSGAEMARYVSFVAERKPFTGAYLTRHEIDETSAERPYRFTVEAVWSE
jgi:hypothetical protein